MHDFLNYNPFLYKGKEFFFLRSLERKTDGIEHPQGIYFRRQVYT